MLVNFENTFINPQNVDYVAMPCYNRVRVVFSEKSFLEFSYPSRQRALEKRDELVNLINNNYV